MPDQPVDRRVRRTKRRLKEALLELIERRDYDRITIEEITSRADVGRSTFYSHYADKEDLLFAGFDHWLMSLLEDLPLEDRAAESDREPSERFRFSLPLLVHIRSQKRFFQATIARGSNTRVQRKVTGLLVELVRHELRRMSPHGRRESREGALQGLGAEQLLEARAHAVVGAFLALASWWLDSGDGLSAEAIDELFQRLVTARSLRESPGAASPEARAREQT